MNWLKRVSISFPAKVTAIVIVAIVIPLVVIVTRYLAQGYVAISVDKPDGWVVIDGVVHATPYTARLKTGRKTVYFGAVGYVEERTRLVVYPFRVAREVTLSPKTEVLYEDDEEAGFLERFEAENPWAKKLPHFMTGQYEIGYPHPDGSISVLFLLKPANYSKGEQDSRYVADLKSAKQKVLQWLKTEGADLSKLTVIWLPRDPDS